jgi:hypothetical protein
MIKKMLGVFSAILLVIIVAAIVYVSMVSLSDPALKPVSTVIESVTGRRVTSVVKPYTTIKKANEYTCGDVEVYYRGPAPSELIGLDHSRLLMKFPEQAGWKIEDQGDEIVITRKVDGLCGMHKEYRHLGLYNGRLAVYQGPLGYDGILLRVEESIKVEALPEPLLGQLRKAADFNRLNQSEQLELKNAIEFPEETTMNNVLENLDEYNE